MNLKKEITKQNVDSDTSYISEKLTNLSERLMFALTTLGITQAELARRIKIKPQAIHYLCNSRSKKSSFTYEIADALNISSLWLGRGEGPMQLENDPNIQLINSQKKVAVLEWNQIKNWMNINKEKNITIAAKEHILTTAEIGPNSFAFRLLDKSMHPRFDQDTIVIICAERTPKNKDYVVAYLKEIDDIVFRQYELEENIPSLKPINISMYKTVPKSEADSILGVMVEARWQQN